MSDIFISYANKDRNRVKPLVEALTARGWSIWWDRTIPAGKTFSEVITKALTNAQCIIVVWSSQSVNSNWVYEEAEEGRNRGIYIPVLIDDVIPPMGFRTIHAADLVGWDGTETSPKFQKLAADIKAVIEPALNVSEDKERSAETEEKHRIANLKNAKKKFPFQVTIWISTGIIAIIVALVFVFVDLKGGSEKPSSPHIPTDTQVPKPERAYAHIFSHQLGFTQTDAEKLKHLLKKNGIPSQIEVHRDPKSPDAIFIGALVSAKAARVAISSVPYEIQYIFRPDYPDAEGGDRYGFRIGIGYMSTHFDKYRGQLSEPVKVSAEQLKYLTELGLSNAEFQRRLREITQF